MHKPIMQAPYCVLAAMKSVVLDRMYRKEEDKAQSQERKKKKIRRKCYNTPRADVSIKLPPGNS